jgi:hypothetical protein
MKKIIIFFLALAGFAAFLPFVQMSHAQNIVAFPCLVSTSPCTSATSLQGNTTAGYVIASVAGYFSPGDAGGGDYVDIGNASSKCASYTGSYIISAGSNSVTGLSSGTTSNMIVGESVSGSGIPPGAEIANITTGSTTSLTMTLAATGPQSGSITISGTNTGTLIVDGETTPQCWQKTNYRGDPHEWGAYGDGGYPNGHDDAVALENWLGAYGSGVNTSPTTPAANFGPWIATVPAIYNTSLPLFCPPNANLQAPANDSRENTIAPLVTIMAGKTQGGNPFNGGTAGTAANPIAVLTAQSQCRISGLAIDANGSLGSSNNNYVDAINIATGAQGVVIDDHALLEHGYFNLYCSQTSGSGTTGMQLKDAQFNKSWSDNIHIVTCPDVKIIGDVIALAGKLDTTPINSSHAGVYYSGGDLTVSNGVIEESQGIGLDLNTAEQVSVVGMYFSGNGAAASGGAGIEIDDVNDLTVTGNRFNENDNNTGMAAITAQVRFGSPSTDVTFAGNIYVPVTISQYAYDVTALAQVVTNGSIFESPQPQRKGIFSPEAFTYLLPFLQFSPGFPNNYITGLTLSNDASSTSKVDFAPGQAVDSTDSVIMSLPTPSLALPACTVDLTVTGVGGLDTGTPVSNRTYFYFLISPAGGAGANCMASASLIPSFVNASGYSLFRMIGALYTTTSPAVVPFVQSDDTFTLVTPAAFPTSGTVATTSTAITLPSVPSQISVEAFGRCEAGAAMTLVAGSITAQMPYTSFAMSPGYTITSPLNPHTSFPFTLYTLGGTGMPPLGTINAAAATSGTTLNCYDDGWIWHRGR